MSTWYWMLYTSSLVQFVIQATTWLEFAVLLGLIIFNLICLAIWIYGRKQARAAKHKMLKEEKTKEDSPVVEVKEASQEGKFGEFAE